MGLIKQGKRDTIEEANIRMHEASRVENEIGLQQNFHKDQQINELSDMVKELLREQQELKEQLNKQSSSSSTRLPKSKVAQATGLQKKASERVPRQDLKLNVMHSANADKQNPREVLNVPLQLKPGEKVDPKDNFKQDKTRQNLLERRRKEKQEEDAHKISAIDQKIENARKRLEEQKKMKS